MSVSQQLIGVQALRGIAALVVVIFHAAVLSVDYMRGALYEPWALIGKAGVDLFFVISGFIMVHTTRAGFDLPGAATRFAISRLSRVYPPYWVLTALVFAYWLYNPSGVNSKTGGVDPVASFLLLPSSSLPLVPVAWTLVHEMFFYLMFWALIAVGSARWLLPALLVWGGACLVNMLAGLYDPQMLVRGLFLSPFNLEFVAGALVAYFGARRWGIAALALGLVWFAAVAAYFQAVSHPEGIPIAERVALFLPPSVALLYGAVAAERSTGVVARALAWFGDWSYSLYLVHILVIHLLYRVATRKLPGDWSTPLMASALALAAVAVSLVASWIFYRWIERPLSAWCRSAMTQAAAKARLLRAT